LQPLKTGCHNLNALHHAAAQEITVGG